MGRDSLVAMRSGHYEADYRTDTFSLIGTRPQQPMQRWIEATRSSITPSNRFPIIIGKEPVHPIILYQQGGLMTTLSLSLVAREMIGRAVTVTPFRIVRKCNMVEEQQKVIS